ncbi:serine/threonine protein kinase [Lachnospira eligens]|jgi:serine/threonine protein kinase|uniref:non-specific serine/threonine protein kinase n=1 Tax=Lachnospira eligens TaxID=39485 RepID=A0A415MBQ7_9FIRM|nr:serine/threonine-protein kinase [Lachnospira eligens]RHA49022.1 serine/threonine protein kinase [Lachnospira eligens]RHL68750.1 serine/threonine protein kinase [Lachnospira eligens]
MTLEEESRLSFYRELTVLDEKKNIVLVQDIRNSELCVKKTLDIYSRDVYEQLASVRIEGVPAVKECVADDGKLIVVEEYVQGRSLKQVLDEQGLLNEEQAYEIAVQLVDILVRLHQLESAIVHRDIKPSNIIIEKNGHVNLIDFNAARHVNADKNEDTRMLGTVYFAAPEQFGFGQSDERTDIYGLGATINYIMTGDKPGAGIAECRFSDILKKCLMVDAKDRYQSAEELRGVLDMLNYSIVQDNRKKAETAFGKDNTVSVVRTYHNIRDIIVKMYRKYQKRNYDIDTSWRRYLLPGFRRLNVVYCLIALVWYAVIVWMTITFAVTDSKTGISVTGGELTMYKIAVFVLLFGMTMWFGNYLNIRRKLPGMKKINVLSTILTFGYAFTISFMFLAFFAIFMAIIGYL